MRCDEVQAYLANHLAGRLADRLSGTVQSYVRSHMLSCPDCCEKLEDFKEMQAVLRTIPIVACDSNAMRARFEASTRARIRAADSRVFPEFHWPRTRQSQFFVVTGTMLILIAALFVAHQSGKWSATRSGLTAPLENHGAVTGQVRSRDGAVARGVRVALMAVPDSGTAPVMDLIRVAPTDDEGRYRLDDVPPGRYYVIAGSVDVPTYFPGTPDVAAATIVSIMPGSVAGGIDFPRFVPARTVEDSNTVAAEPAFPIFLSGTLHYPDGRAASGIPVYAIPADSASTLASEASTFHFSRVDFSSVGSIARAQLREMQNRAAVEGSVTDQAGLYRIAIKVPGSYYIAAGFADSPAYFPGVPEIKAAKSIMSASNMNLDSLHFTVAAPPIHSVSGRIVAASGALSGASVEMRNIHEVASVLPPRPFRNVIPDEIGAFEIPGVPSGSYTLEAREPGVEPVRMEIEVNGNSVRGVQLVLTPPTETGRESSISTLVPVSVTVRLDTGDRLPYKPDTSIIFTGASGNNPIAATSVVGNLFQASVPAGDTYSVSVSNTAAGYAIVSIVSGTVDLLNGGRYAPVSSSSSSSSIIVTLTKRNN